MSRLSKVTLYQETKLFRHNRSQAVHIPVELELPGDRVLIHQEGDKLIIQPLTRSSNLVGLLAEWRNEPSLEDQLPALEDMPAKPQNIF